MDDKQLKSRAEFAGKLLKLELDALSSHYKFKWNGILYHLTPQDIFYNQWFAPILAHLAEQEMERREYWWRAEGKTGEYNGFFTKEISLKPSGWNDLVITEEERYIALWSAIEATGEK